MKIVNRDTFLALPEGTFFTTYYPQVFGDLRVKGKTSNINPFKYDFQSIGSIDSDKSEEQFDILFDAQKNGSSFKLDLNYGDHESVYDDTELFAVWELDDVRQLKGLIDSCYLTYLEREPKTDKWTAIASRYGKVDFLNFGFGSYDEALAHVKAMNDRTDGYPIAILTPAKDKYWMNSFSDREDVEADLKKLVGLSHTQFRGTFET
jgi:hypothetical protein